MTGPAIALLSALALLAAAPAADATERDPHQRAAFVKKHPCPATGKSRGACPGYVVDHIKPLCAGGADRPSNMQWQTRQEAKIKDRREREMCAAYRPTSR
jgi:hypothetical protein